MIGRLMIPLSLLCASLFVPWIFEVRPVEGQGIGEPAGSREAVSLLRSRCVICHSDDLITQQRLDRAHWTAILRKMIDWGAVLSEPERDVLLDYLAARYHPEAPLNEKGPRP